jgi:hypothetical protein
MTTWSLEQIAQARGIHARCDVDEVEIGRHGDQLLGDVHRQLAKSMKHIGHSFAIEVDPRDVQLHKTSGPDAPPFVVIVEAWWEPQVTTVELRGGWKDGERMEYRDAPQPIRILKPPPPLMMSDTISAHPFDPVDIAETYVCTGWHEQERRWIYGPR